MAGKSLITPEPPKKPGEILIVAQGLCALFIKKDDVRAMVGLIDDPTHQKSIVLQSWKFDGGTPIPVEEETYIPTGRCRLEITRADKSPGHISKDRSPASPHRFGLTKDLESTAFFDGPVKIDFDKLGARFHVNDGELITNTTTVPAIQYYKQFPDSTRDNIDKPGHYAETIGIRVRHHQKGDRAQLDLFDLEKYIELDWANLGYTIVVSNLCSGPDCINIADVGLSLLYKDGFVTPPGYVILADTVGPEPMLGGSLCVPAYFGETNEWPTETD